MRSIEVVYFPAKMVSFLNIVKFCFVALHSSRITIVDQLNTFFNKFIIKIRFSLSNVLIRGESNFDDKYVEKSVQLVRGSSFRNDLLQNPYFSSVLKTLLQTHPCNENRVFPVYFFSQGKTCFH